MSTLKKIIFLLIGLSSSLIIGVIVLELFFGNWWNKDDWRDTRSLNIVRSFTHDFRIDRIYEGWGTTSTYIRDQYGLRGPCKEIDKINILTVGGSTTDQRFIAEGLTWQDSLQKNLKALSHPDTCIANAGVDGHSTFGHIESFKIWFSKIHSLEPKLVVLFIGINDAGFRLTPFAGFDTKVGEGESRLKVWLREKSALYGLLRFIRNSVMPKAKATYAEHTKHPFSIEEYIRTENTSGALVLAEQNKQGFSNRLGLVLKQIKQMGSIPICVSQPHLYVNTSSGTKRGVPFAFEYKGVAYSGLDYDASINLLNQEMASQCPAQGGFYIDAASHIFAPEDFYDLVHMTPVGAKKLGDLIAQEMIRQKIPMNF
jgi:lysophospholipase L1-like esterase